MKAKRVKRKCDIKANPLRDKSLNRTNIYCYCMIKKPDDKAGTVPKVIEAITGIDSSNKLYTIAHKDLSMVVSNVPQNEFSENKLNDAIENITWLGRYAVRHEEIVESVMKHYSPLLPMKFCTICEKEARIKTIMEKHYPKFIDALNYFKDKEEYGVKMYVERDVFKKNMKSGFTEAADSDISGRDYLLKRKIEKQTQEIFIIELSSRTKMMHSLISEWTAKSVSNKMINNSSTKDEMLVHNATYLVENKYLDRFLRAIKEINNKHSHEGLKLMTSGPWPPYSFSPKIN